MINDKRAVASFVTYVSFNFRQDAGMQVDYIFSQAYPHSDKKKS